ncbi:S8 family serine peptidase [bacterium]|nr:S8 family serine peptidase [bacterium]
MKLKLCWIIIIIMQIPICCTATILGLKFQDDAGIHLVDGSLVQRDKTILIGKDSMPGNSSINFRKVFNRPVTELQRERIMAKTRTGKPSADLSQCFYMEILSEHVQMIMEKFLSLDQIEFIYELPKLLIPAGYDEESPNFREYQEYLDDPAGPHLKRAWEYDMGTGIGVTVVDIESHCNRDHEELIIKLGDEDAVIGGIPGGLPEAFHHGTAVAGMLIATKDNKGITGICHKAQMKLYFTSDVQNLPDAINTTQAAINIGDVILIELQTAGPNWPGGSSHFGLVPVEWDNLTQIAIANAVALGRIIIQPAGNGSQDLDDPIYADVFGSEATDTGSIIIGAGKPADRSAVSYTNYGSRVNLQGWAERMNPCCQVWTTGYGCAPASPQCQDQLYTDRFSGTSSAAAMVTGAAVCLQSAGKYRQNSVLTPEQLRSILISTGYPQTGTKHIGPLPDIAAAIESIPFVDITVNLTINQDMFIGGDPFILGHFTTNPRSQEAVIRYLVLQCLDEWFFMNCNNEFLPYWTGCPQILAPGETHETFFDFIWPEDDLGYVNPGSGYAFYMAYFNWENELLGNVDYVDFGWQ